MAAITIATMIMLEKVGGAFFASLSPILLSMLALLVVVLVFNTIRAMMRGEICVPE
jgi:tellurite resistance protein